VLDLFHVRVVDILGQIFAGGHNWVSNIALAKTLVSLRGGPAAIVKASHEMLSTMDDGSASFEGPMHFVEGSGSSPLFGMDSLDGEGENAEKKKGNHISSGRLLLEILATYEVFGEFASRLLAVSIDTSIGTLTSGEEPLLLKPGDTAWWFEKDGSNYHLFSVEKCFGMSRGIIELFARVSAFLNRHGSLSPSHSVVHGHPTPVSTRSTTPSISLSLLGEKPPSPDSPLAPIHAEATSLFHEVENWRDTRAPILHARIEHGSEAHRCALLVLMMREAFNIPAWDPRVQQCAEMTLAACYRASANFTMSVE
jgi:hypothetical protein